AMAAVIDALARAAELGTDMHRKTKTETEAMTAAAHWRNWAGRWNGNRNVNANANAMWSRSGQQNCGPRRCLYRLAMAAAMATEERQPVPPKSMVLGTWR